MWEPQFQALRDYRVVAWDMRGHGGTDSPPAQDAYTEKLTVEDMAALLHHLDIEKAVVGGLSLGGYISLEFQLAHPEMVSALVLCNTGARRAAAGDVPGPAGGHAGVRPPPGRTDGRSTPRACSSGTAGTTGRASSRCSRSGSGSGYTTFERSTGGGQRWRRAGRHGRRRRDATPAVARRRARSCRSTSSRRPVTPPARCATSAGFARVELEAGETGRVTVELDRRAFASWLDGDWVVQPGEYTIHVGRSSRDLQPAGAVTAVDRAPLPSECLLRGCPAGTRSAARTRVGLQPPVDRGRGRRLPSASLVRENGCEPKKPLWADSGDGCADSMIVWRDVSMSAFLRRAWLPHRMNTTRWSLAATVRMTSSVNVSQPWPWCEAAWPARTVSVVLSSRTPCTGPRLEVAVTGRRRCRGRLQLLVDVDERRRDAHPRPHREAQPVGLARPVVRVLAEDQHPGRPRRT